MRIPGLSFALWHGVVRRGFRWQRSYGALIVLFVIGSGRPCRGGKRDPVPDLLTSSRSPTGTDRFRAELNATASLVLAETLLFAEHVCRIDAQGATHWASYGE
jgi:hypothetical protein